MKQFNITQVTWREAHKPLRAVRSQVFIDEQQVPVALEWDDADEIAHHLLVLDDQAKPIACARLLNNGSIGRMAVLKGWRGLGLGSALLTKAISLQQQQGWQMISLSAQMHAVSFYQRAGFVVIGQPYLDANIWHVDMQLYLIRP